MNILIMMQGASGSGKSTKAKELAVEYNAEIYSTDDFHIENGVYEFKLKRLGEFHAKNAERSIAAMKSGKNVIVDNTNLQAWECKPYIEAAVALGMDIQFVRCTGDYKNIHGVPDDKVAMMRNRMEDLTVEKVMSSKKPF